MTFSKRRQRSETGVARYRAAIVGTAAHALAEMSLKLLSQCMLKVQGHHRFNMNTLRMTHSHTHRLHVQSESGADAGDKAIIGNPARLRVFYKHTHTLQQVLL